MKCQKKKVVYISRDCGVWLESSNTKLYQPFFSKIISQLLNCHNITTIRSVKSEISTSFFSIFCYCYLQKI